MSVQRPLLKKRAERDAETAKKNAAREAERARKAAERQAFQDGWAEAADNNNDGKLDQQEQASLIDAAVESGADRATVEKALRDADDDGDGVLDADELRQAVLRLAPEPEPEDPEAGDFLSPRDEMET